MLKVFVHASLLACLFVLFGCGSSHLPGEPSWFTSLPQDDNYLYGAKTATSKDAQVAIDKATADARIEIGRQVEVRIQSLQKRFAEETGTGQDAEMLQMFSDAGKLIVSTTVSGIRVKFQNYVQDGDLWRSWVLVEYPIGESNMALLNQIKKNNQMYTRFRATQAFKELEDDTNKYEDWKKQQQ